MTAERTLDQQLQEFRRRRFIAMPIAGTIVWVLVAIAALVVPEQYLPWVLFILTGSIVYLGMGISRLTGENFVDKNRPKNFFDSVFLATVIMALLVYAIAIPFFIVLPESLPMAIGILTGLMWVPITSLIGHWVGIVHGVLRTAAVLLAWYLFPENAYLAISVVIVVLYIAVITILEQRYRRVNAV